MPEMILQALPCRSNVHLYLQMGAPDPSEPVALLYQTTRSYITQECNQNMCSPPWEPHTPKLFCLQSAMHGTIWMQFTTPRTH